MDFRGVLRAFFALFANFFDFVTYLKSSFVFVTIFLDFGAIFRGFGKDFGGIFGEFSMIFQ